MPTLKSTGRSAKIEITHAEFIAKFKPEIEAMGYPFPDFEEGEGDAMVVEYRDGKGASIFVAADSTASHFLNFNDKE